MTGYERILQPPSSIQDIAHCLNHEIVQRGLKEEWTAINCAVEESSIQSRSFLKGKLLDQDKFLRDHINEDDIVIVSIGGNDIALAKNPCTILHLAALKLYGTNFLKLAMHTCKCGAPLPCDDPCLGFSTGCLSDCSTCPPGYGYFLHLFQTRIQCYLELLTAKRKPKLILISTIYYPDETPGDSWAELQLKLLGYNSNPEQLQYLIDLIFRDATSRIAVEGTRVVAVPLSKALNGKDSSLYEQRVEPSALGGQRMAELFMDVIQSELHVGAGGSNQVEPRIVDLPGIDEAQEQREERGRRRSARTRRAPKSENMER